MAVELTEDEFDRLLGANPTIERRNPDARRRPSPRAPRRGRMGFAALTDEPARTGARRQERPTLRHAGAAAARSAGATTVETARSTRHVLAGHKVSLAAFALGLVGYAVGVNLIDGGPAQVKGWLGAKFVNRPYSAPAKSSGSGPAPTGSTAHLAVVAEPVQAVA